MYAKLTLLQNGKVQFLLTFYSTLAAVLQQVKHTEGQHSPLTARQPGHACLPPCWANAVVYITRSL